MMTLREFIEKVNCREHYRIYQPNRDCLIFESYFKVHSPYYFDHSLKLNKDYLGNNSYCNDVYDASKPLDEETQKLLEKFGDYKVIHLECSSFRPMDIYTSRKGKIQIHFVKDKYHPYSDYLNCFNVFIIG